MVGCYSINDSPIYGCFVDASKAFDRVNHSIFFDKLLQRNLSPIVTRTLLNRYSDQRMCISWNSKKSDEFPVSNGVRQGGVLSLVLFTIYIDDLLLELERQGIGTSTSLVPFVTQMTSLCWHPHPLLSA